MEIAGDQPRSPAASLVATAAARIAEQTGSGPGRTSALGQLTDLGFPFSFYEQAPLVGRGVPAITLTTAGNRPPASFGDTPGRLDANRKQLTDIGSAAQDLIGSIDEFGLVDGGRSYVYLGQRLVHGWAIELALVAMLVPFAVAAVDLFARCRRRRIPVLPALRACRSRLGVWLWTGLMFLFLGALGVWPDGAAAPLNPETRAATHWPVLGIVLLASAGATRLARVTRAARAAATGNRRGGARGTHGGRCSLLGLVALLVVATNPFALLFLLPCLHVWLWLPHMRNRTPGARLGLLARGIRRALHPARVDDVPLWAGARRSLVPCGTDRRRLHPDCGPLSRPLLAGGGGPVDRNRTRTIRALSLGGRAARRAGPIRNTDPSRPFSRSATGGTDERAADEAAEA